MAQNDLQLDRARKILGVCDWAGRSDIEEAFANLAYRSGAISQERSNELLAAQKLLLDNFTLDTSPEAKRLRKEAKEKRTAKWKEHWAVYELKYAADKAEKLVPDSAVAQKRGAAWVSYCQASEATKPSIWKTISHLFELTREEKKAVDTENARKVAQDAAWKAWQAAPAEPADKKAELYKLYLDSFKQTPEERKAANEKRKAKKDAAKKALENKKRSSPSEWDTCIHEAGHAVIAYVLGVGIDYAHLGKSEYRHSNVAVGTSAGHVQPSKSPTLQYERLLDVVYTKAGIAAQMKLHSLQPSSWRMFFVKNGGKGDARNEHELLAAYCRNDREAMRRLDKELCAYAEQLVNVHWETIVATAEELLMKGRLYKYELEKIYDCVRRKAQKIRRGKWGWTERLFPMNAFEFPPVKYEDAEDDEEAA
jgi:hypothetical protein